MTSNTANGISEETGRRARILNIAPVFVLPPQPLAFAKWLPSYFLPWNLLFAASAVAYALFVLPDVEVMKTLAWGWILRLFVVNCVAVFLFYGALEYRLYMARAQGNRFKYNAKFPNDQRNTAFLFRSQNIEGLIRGFGTGVPIWTAYEVGILFAFANGFAPWVSFAEHPLYLGCLALIVPIFHEFHFFCIHRLIHWGAALSPGAQRPSQLGQSVAVVVAVDAPG